MSASGLFGLAFNLFAGAAIWTVLGVVVEKLLNIFNANISVFPTFGDVANGLNMMQVAWSAIMVIIFIGLCINYFVNEATGVPGEQ